MWQQRELEAAVQDELLSSLPPTREAHQAVAGAATYLRVGVGVGAARPAAVGSTASSEQQPASTPAAGLQYVAVATTDCSGCGDDAPSAVVCILPPGTHPELLQLHSRAGTIE